MKHYTRKLLPPHQRHYLVLYRNCKASSRKNHGLPVVDTSQYLDPADEDMLHFMLENVSLTDPDPTSPRCLRTTANFIDNLCRTLCPGPWCDRRHCRNYDYDSPYYCNAGKRPASCKDYKTYVQKKEERDAKKRQEP